MPLPLAPSAHITDKAPERNQEKIPEKAPGIPFGDAQEAWFWTVNALRARHENTGARFGGGTGIRIPRPCEPDDVIRAVDRLWRDGHLTPTHLRVLRLCGERGHAPEHHRPTERTAVRLWAEAMAHLGPALHAKGIVDRAELASNENCKNNFLDLLKRPA